MIKILVMILMIPLVVQADAPEIVQVKDKDYYSMDFAAVVDYINPRLEKIHLEAEHFLRMNKDEKNKYDIKKFISLLNKYFRSDVDEFLDLENKRGLCFSDTFRDHVLALKNDNSANTAYGLSCKMHSKEYSYELFMREYILKELPRKLTIDSIHSYYYKTSGGVHRFFSKNKRIFLSFPKGYMPFIKNKSKEELIRLEFW